MDARRALAIAVGGAAGATARWGLDAWFGGGVAAFPWATLSANVAGCALLGVLLVEEWTHRRHRLLLHDLGGIGFCGGLTTMSTLAVEVADLARADDGALAAVYLGITVAAGVAAYLAAGAATRRLRALGQPLEEAP